MMKKIKITENQYKRLFERVIFEDGAPKIGGSKIPFAKASQVGITSTVTDTDGNEKDGDSYDADDVTRKMGNSNVMGNTVGGYRMTTIR